MILILKWIKTKWQNMLDARKAKKDKRKRNAIRKRKEKAKKKQEKKMSKQTYISNKNVNMVNVSNTNTLDVDSICYNEHTREKKKLKTFTKKWVEIILSIALIDIQLVFVLAFLNKDQIAETLGVALVTEVIGVCLGYFAKSYCESNAEAKNDLEYERMKHEYVIQPHSSTSGNENNSNDAVG